MRRLFWLLPAWLFIACHTPQNPRPFKHSMLADQVFHIISNKDTTLQTLHGSLIKIAANSFNVTGNIEIQVKEALTAAEIMSAGLTTESNGRPLRSGGMIYINALADGKNITLQKPINLSIPNSYYDSAMQVFKGVETDSGNINWVEPYPTDTTGEQAKKYTNGKAIFQTKCYSCHVIGKDATAPNLVGVEERIPDRKKIYDFVRNPAKTMQNDPYFLTLKSKYGQTMTAFPGLTDNDIDAILYYIKTESVANPALLKTDMQPDIVNKPSVDTASQPIADCGEYTIYLPTLKQDSSFLAQSPVFEMPEQIDTFPRMPAQPEMLEGLRGGFTDNNPTAGMYDFQIKTLGWYNIDAFVEGYSGTTTVKLWASIEGDMKEPFHVYLFCPDKKMLSVAYDRLADGRYFFDKMNDGIPLFLGNRAILFAFGSIEEKMYYGITEFHIKQEQEIKIVIKETTEAEMKKMLYQKKIEGIDIHTEKKEKKTIKIDCNDSNNQTDTLASK